MPGEKAWLVGEWRSNDERKYYLSNLPADATLKALAAAIKARWVCEQAHQQMKEELGLDHFEGRSWQGLHRHALMAMIAYAFLQHRRLQNVAREKKKRRIRRGPPEPTLPAVRRAVINALALPTANIRCPHCEHLFKTGNSILPK
ncbi:SRSO17 transposase [Neorhizobium galegae]|uniref:transposase n=1 Tax=Neorhizobium galegae TaxID=399 RepID=UPI0027817073|nr:SRSO17 transposase [Neorhizobium galegae]